MATIQREASIQREELRNRAELRQRARREAAKAIDEEALELAFKAAGARRVEPEARRALKAILEETAAELAERATQVAKEREREAIDAECIACATLRANPARLFE